ncbi:MAG: 1-acyl-sn-glycerol-3-phosphate acyltransferase [Clostridia bacterium]|nr:1-acyl-sn-glycerol-3-phosphate acyltransferase [Clostridia bacterium]
MLKKIGSGILRAIFFIADKIIYRTKIVGLENVPTDKAAIICGNHVNALDAPALVAICNRKIRFMAKKELFDSFFFRMVASVYGVFPVDRKKKDTEAIKASLKVLKNNEILGIYPEGTRNGMEKGIKPKNGAVNIAMRAGVPVIPFGVQGSFKPFTKVIYTFGEPIDYSGFKDKAKDKEFVDILTKELMAKIVELRDIKY